MKIYMNIKRIPGLLLKDYAEGNNIWWCGLIKCAWNIMFILLVDIQPLYLTLVIMLY